MDVVRPNVLLVVMDSARADHTSVHGYERPTTPNLERLAADGYRFDRAFAAAPWTPPSHASLFGGVHPTSHGFLDAGMPFRPPHAPLAERLRREGYRTFGAAQNSNITSESELTDGFEEFCDLYRIPFVPESFEELRSYYLDLLPGYARMAYRTLSADRKHGEFLTTEYMRTRIRRAAGREPFFGFINVLAPHSKYAPPEPYLSQFRRPAGGSDPELVEDLAFRGGYRFMAGEVTPTEADWDAVVDLYDGEIAFADAIIGRLVRTLKSAGVYDDTLVIVTADHGEHFGEHGRAYHQFSLFDELLHVPMVVKPPRPVEDGSVSQELVSLVDVYPTVLSELGFPVPETAEGRSLFAEGEREAVFAEYGEPETAISSLQNHAEDPVDPEVLAELDHALQCVRTHDEKYVRVHGGEDALYAVGTGTPKDTLIRTGTDESLGHLLTETLGDDLSVETIDTTDKKMIENLEALGYR